MERRKPSKIRNIAQEIKNAWQETVEGIFKTGDLLIEAKDGLEHGEWKAWISENLPFGYDTANRLCNIASNQRLRKVAQAQLLPTSYTTLAELASLEPEDLEAAIQEGLIKPDMIRADVEFLKSSPKPRRHEEGENNPHPEDTTGIPDPRLESARNAYFAECAELGPGGLQEERDASLRIFGQLLAQSPLVEDKDASRNDAGGGIGRGKRRLN